MKAAPGFPLLKQLGVRCLMLPAMVLACIASPASGSAAGSTNSALLRLMNRDIFRFEAASGLFSPEQRREGFLRLIEDALDDDGPGRVSTLVNETNALVLIDGKAVTILIPADARPMLNETLESVAEGFAGRLQVAVLEAKELNDHQRLARSVISVLATTAVLVMVILFWVRKREAIEDRLMRFGVKATNEVKSSTVKTLSRQNLVGTIRAVVGALMWLTILLSGYLWLEFALVAFPATRPVGERLGREVIEALFGLAHALVRSLPDIGVLLVIWFMARFISAAVRRFFYAAARGHFRSQMFDSATAPMTGRLMVVLVWVAAAIVAFPYIPGSDTDAFKGVSVLAGLMVSLGSGSIVGQVVAGLVAVYTRVARPGDYVRIGGTEGTVERIGLFNTTIRTVWNEQVYLPNQKVATEDTLNYTRRAAELPLWLYTEVTIGYDTPWRQVHAMLAEAARRTPGLIREPAPFTLQTGLEDYYPRYRLNVVIEKPEMRIPVMSALHAHIQDVFNEHGVQIMSPSFRSNPPEKVWVPKDRWYAAPATREEPRADWPSPPPKT
ncbi:MAG: mechanosensitive ion channel [Verrucomicrobiae bacterium]|nr:mechanosensitive ion channel [Verrucomicrobiae bacterium]